MKLEKKTVRMSLIYQEHIQWWEWWEHATKITKKRNRWETKKEKTLCLDYQEFLVNQTRTKHNCGKLITSTLSQGGSVFLIFIFIC